MTLESTFDVVSQFLEGNAHLFGCTTIAAGISCAILLYQAVEKGFPYAVGADLSVVAVGQFLPSVRSVVTPHHYSGVPYKDFCSKREW